jgi:hypothetical protein
VIERGKIFVISDQKQYDNLWQLVCLVVNLRCSNQGINYAFQPIIKFSDLSTVTAKKLQQKLRDIY